MKVYLNAEGEILQTVPSAIPRGTTVADFEVEAPIAALAITVRFSLRAGVTDPLLLPRISSVSSPGLNVWSAKLPYAVTEYSGTIAYQIEVQDANGYIIASPRGTLTITPGIAPVLPDNPPIDAWRSMMDYLQRIYDSVAASSGDTAKLEEAIADINQWIADLQSTHAIADENKTYEMVESYLADKLQELVEKKHITHNSRTYRLIEQSVYIFLGIWAELLANDNLLAGESVQREEFLQLTGGKHLRFTSDEEMEPLNDMLDDYQNGEIGAGDVESVNGKTGAVELTASDVGAEPAGNISLHNTSPSAHTDIREAMRGMLTASDIVDNLTTQDSAKPLSAAQGVELKRMIDSLPSGGADEVYILSEGESLDNAPDTADVVIDPYGEATPAVVSINGIKPDASGNINLPIYNGEVEAI